jgi:putative restriction endonuclease
MPRLGKPDLLGKIIDTIKICGWRSLLLTSRHPFRLRIFGGSETYTVKIYIWNLTHGGGAARPADEYRIQITGITRFEPDPEGKTLILGWWDEGRVFAGFDYRKHSGALGASPSIQIRERFLREAHQRGFSPCDKGNREIAIAFRPDFFVEYVRALEDLHDAGKVRTDFEALKAVSVDPFAVNDADLSAVTAIRKKAIASVLRSLRDRSFRERVLNSYAYRCAMCGIQLELVEAAHIVPVQVPGSTDETSNGLALCSLHHLAYDKALVTVSDDYHVLVSSQEKARLREMGYDEGMESFVANLRQLILLPPDVRDRPKVNYLRRGREIRAWVE